MKASVEGLECVGCGAPLEGAASGSMVDCHYCGRSLRVLGREHRTEAVGASAPSALVDRLLHGPEGRRVGRARRLVAADLSSVPDHELFPTAARASSEYGGGWSSAVLIGPPRVFPGHGDRAGTWAPKTRHSRVEWIEVDYKAASRAHALRVYETHMAGSVYAVTAVTEDGESLLWEAPPDPQPAPRVLEVELDPPRAIHRLRVYVDNTVGSSWSEVDTVSLVCESRLPAELVAGRPSPSHGQPSARRPRARGVLFTVAAVGILAGVMALSAPGSRPPPAPRPLEQLAGSRAMRWTVAPAKLRSSVIWANRVVERSAEYSTRQNAARQALGPPDVWPGTGDFQKAWAPRDQDAGLEWITVSFPDAVYASAVVWVETFNPGAVARVDDLTDPDRPVVLWEGQVSVSGEAIVHTIELAEPRTIHTVRLVLDTTRVSGWNEIDAIGLYAHRP